MNCPVCNQELDVQLITTRKGRRSIMLVCATDGRHFRGFINDPTLLRRATEEHVGIREALGIIATEGKWVKWSGKKTE